MSDKNAMDMRGWTKHTPYHWQRRLAMDVLDFWPTRGRWRWRGKSYKGTPWALADFIEGHKYDAPAAEMRLIED